MTKEREAEIRYILANPDHGPDDLIDHLAEVVADVDRLRADNKALGYQISGMQTAMAQIREERNTLRRLISEAIAKIDRLRSALKNAYEHTMAISRSPATMGDEDIGHLIVINEIIEQALEPEPKE